MKARRFTWRGEVVASGVWLVRDARARALRAWSPGVVVTEVDDGLVVRWPSARAIRVDAAPGHLLVDVDGRLCTAPLDADQLGPVGTLHRVRGEQVQELVGQPVDPADWLELDMPILDATSLGLEPQPIPVAPSLASDGRAALGQGPPTADVEALLAALAAGRTPPAEPPAWAQAMGGALAGLRSFFDGAGAGEAASRSEPGWLDQLDSWLAEQMVDAGLGSLVGKAHADHLRQLMEMLDGDDVDAALRHAIPLGGEGGLAKALAGLRRPDPRGSLRVTAGGASSSIAIGDTLMETLREQYRTMVRRLKASGEIEKAAFVLAELLNLPLEAVSLLEEHELWAAAAELAEVRKLDPALCVRLWFLAGELDRAVDVARRRGGLDGAVDRLESRDPGQARHLRIVWAASLASSGCYAAACTHGRRADLGHTAALRSWSDKAIEAGGHGGALELVARLESEPSDWRPRYAQAEPWLDGSRPARELGQALGRRLPSAAEPLARKVLRRMLADRVRDGDAHRSVIVRLRQQVSGGLNVDRPTDALPPPPSLREATEPHVVTLGPDPGASIAHAAVWLPSRRWLVARGEAGLELLDATGRRLRRWERPAHDLAVHLEGTQVIAMAHRGALRHLSRVDLTDGSASDWCDARIDGFARTFERSWIVQTGSDLLAIDPSHEAFRGTWRLDFPSPPQWVAYDRTGLNFVAEDQHWRIAIPALALLSRDPVQAGLLGQARSRIVAAAGRVLLGAVEGDDGWRAFHSERGQGLALDGPPLDVQCQGGWLAIATAQGVVVIDESRWMHVLHLRLPGLRGIDLTPTELAAWDDHGRAVAVDLATGRIASEIRIS